jgi:hypothetical protein
MLVEKASKGRARQKFKQFICRCSQHAIPLPYSYIAVSNQIHTASIQIQCDLSRRTHVLQDIEIIINPWGEPVAQRMLGVLLKRCVLSKLNSTFSTPRQQRASCAHYSRNRYRCARTNSSPFALSTLLRHVSMTMRIMTRTMI